MKKALSLITLSSLFLSIDLIGQEKPIQENLYTLSSFDFFIGEWNITNLRVLDNGEEIVVGHSKSIAYYILDNSAILDEFRSLDQNGSVVFRGISIRSFNNSKNQFQVVWLVPGVETLTDIKAIWKNGNIVTEAMGYDTRGDFLEHLIYYNITDSTYSMKMDRSYDDGKTWIKNFGRFNAKKIKSK